MNELRLILIGIGLLFITGIYLWDVYTTRKHIRSRVEKFSTDKKNRTHKAGLTAKDDIDDDDLEALSEFQNIINNSRHDEQDSVPVSLSREPVPGSSDRKQEKPRKKEKKDVHDGGVNKLIVLYIMADKNRHFTGPGILEAARQVGMRYGSMDIFHYYESGEIVSKKALFSLINIVEPGLFDIKQMEKFSTHGLALFMQVSEENDNELVFDMMLDAAWKLVEILGGELHDEQHNVIDPLIVNSLREKLYS